MRKYSKLYEHEVVLFHQKFNIWNNDFHCTWLSCEICSTDIYLVRLDDTVPIEETDSTYLAVVHDDCYVTIIVYLHPTLAYPTPGTMPVM